MIDELMAVLILACADAQVGFAIRLSHANYLFDGDITSNAPSEEFSVKNTDIATCLMRLREHAQSLVVMSA